MYMQMYGTSSVKPEASSGPRAVAAISEVQLSIALSLTHAISRVDDTPVLASQNVGLLCWSWKVAAPWTWDGKCVQAD